MPNILFCGIIVSVVISKTMSGISHSMDAVTESRGSLASSWKRSGEKETRNHTVFLGYANNPFGPSKRLHHKKEKINITFNIPSTTTASYEDDIDNSIETNFEPRSKRGVVNLYNMVSCSTGCNPLIFKGYGCYCGFLGSGYPVDGIDRCCKNHDWCYDTADCPMYLEYFVPYYWKCYHGKSLCAIDHLEWGGSGSCAQRLCECDRVLSECLSKFPCPSSRAMCRSSSWRLLQNAFMIF